jgi:hypothetical protein
LDLVVLADRQERGLVGLENLVGLVHQLH